MGYSTDFYGRFELDRPLTPEQAEYLRKFSETRRMARNATVTAKRPDPVREAVGLPVGDEGEYFVGGGNHRGQEDSLLRPIQEELVAAGATWGDALQQARDRVGILNLNQPPGDQPGLWCQWVPTDDLCGIEWDGGEKFYRYVEWLQYICDHFLRPWGVRITGKVSWQGEESGDTGTIHALGYRVSTKLSALEQLARAADEE